MRHTSDVQIEQIFISPEHNFVGHYGQPPGTSPLIEQERIECVAGKGLLGDRYFNHAEDYKGQITFFSAEVFERLCTHFGIREKSAGVLRRNVIVSGIDLLSLIGCNFEMQGVKFRGTQHCAPCEWMDVAFAPSASSPARSSAIPLSLAACAVEKKQLCSRFSMSSPSVCKTREAAPVSEKTSRNIARSRPSASPRPRPSAKPAVLIFITMLTSAFTFAASPAFPT